MTQSTRRILLVSLLGLSATAWMAAQVTHREPAGARTAPRIHAPPPPVRAHAASAQAAVEAGLSSRESDVDVQGAVEERLARSWHMDQLMVRASVPLSALADRHGGSVSREAGLSGFGALRVPEGTTLAAYRQRLSADADVEVVSQQGRTFAASVEGELEEARDAQRAAADAESEAVVVEAAAQQTLDDARDDLNQLLSTPGTHSSVLDQASAAVRAAQDVVDEAQEDRQEATDLRVQADAALAEVLGDFRAAMSETDAVQWHLSAAVHPYWKYKQYTWMDGPPDVSADIWVAVLDSGLAMSAAGVPLAPSLQSAPIVAPWDAVDGDDLPADGHGHGTHVTGLIAGSSGSYGVAPGVSIMPVRVLDDTNSGTELDLIEGLHHAAAEGADIINLSLTMGPDYVPSPALLDALRDVAEQGIVVVAASGNDAATATPWPAASPQVIAVGATMQSQPEPWAQQRLTPFSNQGGGVDLAAPSGDLAAAELSPGLPNGLIAESFAAGDLDRVGLWAFSGTSQSAALVSGAAAMLLEQGIAPANVSAVLQKSARYLDWRCPIIGCGAGSLDLQNALNQSVSEWGGEQVVAPAAASVLPWVKDEGWTAVVMFDVAVVDDDGLPLAGAEVRGRAWSSDGDTADLSCYTDWQGTCSIQAFSGQAELIDARSYVGQLDVVRSGGVGMHPTPLAFATDGLAVIQAAMAEQPGFEGALLGIHWDATQDPVLGSMRPAYAVMNYGTGLSSSPLGVVFGENALPVDVTMSAVSLDLDGAGLASSPLGLLPTTRLVVDGTGLSSSPLGLMGGGAIEIALLSSEGLSATTLGLDAAGLALPMSRTGGTGLSSSPLGFQGQAILLGSGELVGGGDSSLATALSDGSWVGGEKVGAATELVASGVTAATVQGQGLAPRVPVALE